MFWLGGFVWKIAIIGALLGLMVFAAIILVALFSQMAQAQTLKGQVPAHITSEFGVALCKEPEDILRLSQIVGQKDHEAFEKLMIYLIITSRKCTILKPGTPVIVEQVDMDHGGAVCVRPRSADGPRPPRSLPTYHAKSRPGRGQDRRGKVWRGWAWRGAARQGTTQRPPRRGVARVFCLLQIASEGTPGVSRW